MDAVLHFWERHYCFSKIKKVEYYCFSKIKKVEYSLLFIIMLIQIIISRLLP